MAHYNMNAFLNR